MYVPECKLISTPVLIQFSVKAKCKLVISTSVVAACIIRSSGSYTHECQIMSGRIIATEWGHNSGKDHTSECKLSSCQMQTEGELSSFAAVSSVVPDGIILTVCLL